jgi:rod shape determining protein RodA
MRRQRMGNRSLLLNLDWFIFLLTTFLILIGVVNIYSAVSNGESFNYIFNETNFGKQVIWLGVTLVLFFLIMIIDVRFFINISYVFYIITILLLIVTIVIGKEVSGAKSWLVFGGFSLQPSELAKVGTALAIARFMDRHEFSIDKLKDRFRVFIIIGIPMVLVVLQNDIGSALVFLSFVLVLYREGLPPYFLLIPLYFGVLFIVSLLVDVFWIIGSLVFLYILVYFLLQQRKTIMIVFLALGLLISIGFVYSSDYVFYNVLQSHHRERIMVLFGKNIDPQGNFYNIHQALIAIGSGGFEGKGFLEGTQTRGDFIPEQSTDFIFCTVAEEHGFIGSSIMVLLFIFLLIRIIFVSERQKFKYNRVFGYSLASVIFIHFFINLGMTMNLLPVIGIPLPFISYGGSSLLGFTIFVTLFLKLDADYKHYFN